MAKTGGYFLQGLAGGLSTGFNMGQQLQEMKWKKDQQKKLEEKQQKITDGATMYSNLVKQYGSDNIYTDEEIMQLNTVFLASSYDVQEVLKDTNNAIQTMNKSKLEQDYQWLDLYASWIEGLDPKNVGEIYNTVKGQIQSEKGKQILEAYTNIHKKKYEAIQAQPKPEVFTSPSGVQGAYPEAGYEYSATAGGYIPTYQKPTTSKAAGISDYNTAVNYLSKFTNPDVFEKQKNMIQKNTGLDLSGVTFESLKTPEKVVTPTPKVQDANEVLFGTNGIMKNYINSGSQLGDQQKAEIRNNYDIIKPSLTANVKTQVEEYLKQIGIDVNAPVQAQKDYTTMSDEELSALPNDSLAVEELKNRKPSGGFHPITAIKNWLGQKGGQGVSPTGNVAASSVNQQQNYTTMSDDQLADLALTGDQAAIDELKRRGLL